METINIDNALYLTNAGIGLTIVPESVKNKVAHKIYNISNLMKRNIKIMW